MHAPLGGAVVGPAGSATLNAHPSTLAAETGRPVPRSENHYLDLLAKVLTGTIEMESLVPKPTPVTRWRRAIYRALTSTLSRKGIVLAVPTSLHDRQIGRDWPTSAVTMVGLARLINLRDCVVDVLEAGVPGDLFEAGVWRGGAGIYMRAVLEAHGDGTRRVWLADSFQGLPRPNPDEYPADSIDMHYVHPELAVGVDEVTRNFERFGLLDDRVRFLEGWFQDTLATAPVEEIAVLRLDGDMYESTWVALESLYDKVPVGGYVIIDDYGLDQCRAAVDEFRAQRGIVDPLERVDWTGAYWRRAG